MPLINPVQSIEKIYQEGRHKVPYPVFLKCLNKLLQDPAKGTPAQPADELEPYFRGVCQAIDVGVADSLGREKDRQKEFYERIYPVWKQKLSPEKLKQYEDILDATIRHQLDKERHEQEKLDAEIHQRQIEEDSIADAEQELHSQFAALSKAALAEEDAQAEEEEQQQQQQQQAAPSEAQAEAGAAPDQQPAAPSEGPAEQAAPEAMELDDLVEGIVQGQIPLTYSDPREKKPFVTFLYHGQEFVVHLVKSVHSFYLTVTCPVGLSQRPDAAPEVGRTLSDHGYSESEPLVYKKKAEATNLRLKLGKESAGVALKQDSPFTEQRMTQALLEMHADLTAVLLLLLPEPPAAEQPEPEEDPA